MSLLLTRCFTYFGLLSTLDFILRYADELDIVAMDQFQRDFFLIRAAEYEPYVKSLGIGLVTQGDLTDPYYFDFISFAQYLTINRVISKNPPMVFEEQQAIDRGEDVPNEFVTKIVRRDSSLTNDRLVLEHSQRVGAAILNRLDEIFGDTPSSLPKFPSGSRPDAGMCNVESAWSPFVSTTIFCYVSPTSFSQCEYFRPSTRVTHSTRKCPGYDCPESLANKKTQPRCFFLYDTQI
jgi:hypothetical protein